MENSILFIFFIFETFPKNKCQFSINPLCFFTLRQLGLTKVKSFPEFCSFLRLRADVLLSDRVDVAELGDDKLDHFRHTGDDGDRERCADDRHK